MNSDSAPLDAPRAARGLSKPIWALVKWALFAVVLAFVGRHAYRLWGQVDPQAVRLNWGWLALALVVSIAGWVPSAIFWRQLMAILNAHAPWLETLAAYYCGHLGKYVPGKATTLVVRAAMLRPCGVPAAVAAFAATMETLTYIAAGTATAVALLPRMLADAPRFRELAAGWSAGYLRLMFPLLAVAISVTGLVVFSRLSRWMARRVRARVPGAASLDQPVPARFYVASFAAFLAAWWLQGAVLGLTLQAISVEPVDWRRLPDWTGDSAVALVGGFLAVFAPGGLGVREGLLMELLHEQVGPHEAVLATVLVRVVSFVGEVLASATLYAMVRGARSKIDGGWQAGPRRPPVS